MVTGPHDVSLREMRHGEPVHGIAMASLFVL